MPDINADDYLKAADTLLAKIERSRAASRKELEPVRAEISKQVRDDARKGVGKMGTINLGGQKILLPNRQNLAALNLASERARERTSSFRLNFLSREQVEQLRRGEGVLPEDPKKFIRHSRRLARHTREFLQQIQELEPGLEEEVQETLAQLEDNDMDLLKLEVKSFTRMRETLVRGVAGRKIKPTVLKELESYDIDRNLWNLSVLSHPKATVQGLLANSAERMAAPFVTTRKTTLPKATMVLAAPTPDAATKMTDASRTANVVWRMFTAQQLDSRYEAINVRQRSPTSWRGLGLDYNTPEWYLPVPPQLANALRPIVAARRAALLKLIAGEGEE